MHWPPGAPGDSSAPHVGHLSMEAGLELIGSGNYSYVRFPWQTNFGVDDAFLSESSANRGMVGQVAHVYVTRRRLNRGPHPSSFYGQLGSRIPPFMALDMAISKAEHAESIMV